MILFLIALFVIAPIAEIYVLLAAGGAFGVWPVIFACVATAVIGGFLLRLQGLKAIAGAQRDLQDGKVPVEAAVDGVFLAIAAPMLMLPGFLTDALGFLLLTPPFRHAVARAAFARLKRSIDQGETRVEFRRF